jgi:outer membrane protein assembly factor BamB
MYALNFSPGRLRALRIGVVVGASLLAGCDNPVRGGRTEPANGPGGLQVLFKVPVERADNAFVPATDGQRLYADVDRRIEAFDLSNGAKLWSYQRPLGGPSSLVARNGRLFFAGDTAVALDAATGRELWRYPLDSPAGLGESDGDADAYYVGTHDHRVYAFRAADGGLLWSRDLGPDWPFGGVVRGMTVSGDTVYAAVEHNTGVNGYIGTGDIFALDRRTGAVLWVNRNGDGTGLDIYQSAGRVAGRLLLLNADWQGEYIALDRFTNSVVWRVPGGDSYFTMDEAPEVAGQRVYVAGHDLHAMALDLASGRVVWRTQVRSGANNVAPCGDRLLVQDLGLSVIDLSDGRFLGQGYDSSVNDALHTDFVVVGNRAYVFGRKHLYAFECPA